MSLIKNLKLQDSGEHTGIAYINLFDSDIRITIEKETSVEYADTCISHLNKMTDDMRGSLLEKITRYCKFIIDECDLDINYYQDVFGLCLKEASNSINYSAILKHVKPSEIVIEKPEQPIPAYSIYCNCDWEPEHGLEIIIKGDNILYVSETAVLGPWRRQGTYKCSF